MTKVEHINKGPKSVLTLRCILCDYTWTPVIDDVINRGSGCSDCVGRAHWTFAKFLIATEKIENIDFTKITEEHVENNNNKTNLPVSCKICEHNWEISINNLINHRRGCPKCANKIPYTKPLVLEKLKYRKDLDLSKIREDINGDVTIVIPKCTICFNEWEITIKSLMAGRGCPICAGPVGWDKARLLKHLGEQSNIDLSKVSDGSISPIRTTKLQLICKDCDNEWEQYVANIIQGSNCSKCRPFSRGVKAITNYLDKNGIFYIMEKTFTNLRDIYPLRIDIYIPIFSNFKYPISLEYDCDFIGSHFKYDNETTKVNHINTVKRDRIKDEYCISNDIHMFRIPYTCFKRGKEEQITSILEKELEFLSTCKEPIVLFADSAPYIKRDKALQILLEEEKSIQIVKKKKKIVVVNKK
jgi:hypothetical protein